MVEEHQVSKNAKVSLCWVAITTALLALLFVAARSRTGSGAVQLSPTTTTTIYTEQRVHTAEELDILVDPTGTPYDSGSILWGPEAVRREPLTTFVAPDGVLAVMDGNAVQVNPFGFRDGASTVTLAGERLDVFVFREFYERDGEEWSSVLGVEVSVPGTEVAAWGDVEFGYGTDGGVGGIITESAINSAKNYNGDSFVPADYELDIERFDVDGIAGDDTIVFSNGAGDGGFPMVRGFDREGVVVSLVVFDTGRYPWRLMFPGTPPPTDVTEMELALAECLAGERTVTVWKGPDRTTRRCDAE